MDIIVIMVMMVMIKVRHAQSVQYKHTFTEIKP